MMKPLTSVVLALVVVLTCSGGAYAAEPDPASKAADHALDSYKRHLPWEQFGFATQEEWLKARPEESVPVFWLDITMVAEGTSTIANALTDGHQVEFLVTSENRPVSRLTLRQVGDSYEREGFGGSGEGLLRGLDALPARTGARLIHFGPAEFLYLSHGRQEFMVYISKHPLDGIESFKLYTAEQILPHLQEFARSMKGSPDRSGGMSATSRDEGGTPPSFPTPWLLVGGTAIVLGAIIALRRFALR